ncbi:hypothetical protein NQ318_009423 [Aromia moschata]|uniref:T-box domain-containing protein n=1 Tax=Aromia moschata TaxID=1265417 RepID=A0AAV8Z6V0_9CUCU|nr:hypothetical protein NQ318_009423 [Aromia moschata]
MFPSLHIQISDLDPRAHYCILLELTPATRCRYKYSNSGGWVPAGTEEAQSPQRIYLHPESPATGEYWMSQPVSFGRLKLTNTPAPPIGHVVLSSMHKYQPRIIIAKTSDPRSIVCSPSSSVVFRETEFIAVTAYQNERITKLKIDNNPFAKGFRENGQSKCKRKRLQIEEKTPNEQKAEESVATKTDDEISVCSSTPPPSSPEVSHQRTSLSPVSSHASVRCTQNYPVVCNYRPVLPHPTLPMMNYYPYYYPHYSTYSPMWVPPSPYFYQHPFHSPPAAEDLTVPPPAEKKPKKINGFFY